MSDHRGSSDRSLLHRSPPSGIAQWLPGLASLRGYPRAWLRHDVVAGVVLAAFLVPVGMGYAQASGLPAINGLYATIVPLVVYAVFGPSRVMIMGPDSSLAPLIAALVVVLARGAPENAVEIAGVLAITTGVLIAAAGLLRLGFVTELLSRPARLGFLTGIALTIVVGQLPALFGFPSNGGSVGSSVFARLGSFFHGVADGETNATALAVGLVALTVIVALARWAPRVPGVLVAVVGGIAFVAIFDPAIATVGTLPSGLPTFHIPLAPFSDLPEIASAALAIALVAIADTTVLSQSLAMQRHESVDPNQELIALGAANAVTGLFQGFPVSCSASRTPVATAAGARSQVAPLVGAASVAAMLLFVPGLLRDLPQAALAAVVISAATRLVKPADVAALWRTRRAEFVLWLAAFVAVAVLGVLPGIFIAIVLSLGDFVRRAWRPHDAVLGRVDELKGYHDVSRFPQAKQVPGLLLYRFDAPLFFANAEYFQHEIRDRLAAADPEVRWIVVGAEPMTDVDSTAAAVLGDLLDDLEPAGVVLAFAEMKDPVKDQLRRYGLFDRIGEDRFFPTLGTAVKKYLSEARVPWADWEDRPEADGP